VGEIEDFSRWRNRLDCTFELADVRVTGAKIGKKGDQVGHMFGRLASDEPRGKGKEKE
jgi:hypothetical protein